MLATLCLISCLADGKAGKPLLLAHYMPWFQSKPVTGSWGWHWTMNHFNPDKTIGGQPEIASRYHPLIGPYDSGDPDALECQCLLMKLSGIDGIVLDWYGTDDVNDYAQVNRNAERMANEAEKTGLKFAIIYEDHTLSELIKHKAVSASDAIAHGKSTLAWLSSHWFNRPGYLKWQGRPVFLVFGPQFYRDDDFSSFFAGLPITPAYFRLLDRKGPAVGGFGWPGPQPGEAKSWTDLDAFYARGRTWPAEIGVAYPRFEDIYKDAGVGPGYGLIADHNGETFRRTLDLALSHSPFAVQLATWNDWGEGTQIEPSVEVGFRDLEATQAAKRRITRDGFAAQPANLRLPVELYRLRKRYPKGSTSSQVLDGASQKIRAGRFSQAQHMLDSVEISP
jgi:hypothetical protein